jgi:hypothetical protein
MSTEHVRKSRLLKELLEAEAAKTSTSHRTVTGQESETQQKHKKAAVRVIESCTGYQRRLAEVESAMVNSGVGTLVAQAVKSNFEVQDSGAVVVATAVDPELSGDNTAYEQAAVAEISDDASQFINNDIELATMTYARLREYVATGNEEIITELDVSTALATLIFLRWFKVFHTFGTFVPAFLKIMYKVLPLIKAGVSSVKAHATVATQATQLLGTRVDMVTLRTGIVALGTWGAVKTAVITSFFVVSAKVLLIAAILSIVFFGIVKAIGEMIDDELFNIDGFVDRMNYILLPLGRTPEGAAANKALMNVVEDMLNDRYNL